MAEQEGLIHLGDEKVVKDTPGRRNYIKEWYIPWFTCKYR